jgi:hypothetical protein
VPTDDQNTHVDPGTGPDVPNDVFTDDYNWDEHDHDVDWTVPDWDMPVDEMEGYGLEPEEPEETDEEPDEEPEPEDETEPDQPLPEREPEPEPEPEPEREPEREPEPEPERPEHPLAEPESALQVEHTDYVPMTSEFRNAMLFYEHSAAGVKVI